MDMPIEMAHQKLLSANLQLIQNYYEKRQNGVRKSANKLYNGDTSFRGFREV
jgi:hypothetical protein